MSILLSHFFYDMEVFVIEAKYDKEYSTQWIAEKEWLSKHGIKYVFVKSNNGITTYKYTKTLELFKSLVEFYENVYTK